MELSSVSPPPRSEPVDTEPFLRELLHALVACREGEFSARMPVDLVGLPGKIADVLNDILTTSARRSIEIERVCRAVGKEGRLKERMHLPEARGLRAAEVAAINTFIDDLVWPTTEVTRTIGALAKGDLSQSVSLEIDGRPLEGEFLRSAELVNRTID